GQDARSLAAAGAATGIVSERVIALAEGALQAMQTRTKIAAGVMLTLVLIGLGVGLGYSQPLAPATGQPEGRNLQPDLNHAAPAAALPPPALHPGQIQTDPAPARDLPELVALAEMD